MSGAESKTATLRMATEKLHELKGGNIEGAVAQKKLENKIKAIEDETQEIVKQIKQTPIDKEQIKQQAKIDYDSKVKANAREALLVIKQAEQCIDQARHNVDVAEKDAHAMVKQAELDLEEAKRNAEKKKHQAQLDVKASIENLEQAKEVAKEQEERRNLRARYEYEAELKSASDAEKAMQLKIDKALVDGKRKKKELEEELDILKLRNSSKNSGEELYERLFNSVKEISISPAEPLNKGKN